MTWADFKMFLPEALRQVGWALAWCFIVGMVLGALFGDSPWNAMGTVPATMIGLYMARNRSLRWRWLMIKHRNELDRPLVFNEDGELHSGLVLPFERVLAIYNTETNKPVHAHIETRDLLGRQRVRSHTDWPE